MSRDWHDTVLVSAARVANSLSSKAL